MQMNCLLWLALQALIIVQTLKVVKVARNYSYVASTTANNNAAAGQLPAIKLIMLLNKKGLATDYHLVTNFQGANFRDFREL